MIEASARQLADQFFLAFSRQLQAPDEPPETETAGALPAPSAQRPAPDLSPSARATARPAPPTAPGEGVRVLWFALGAAATAFGFWVASALTH